MPAGTCSTTIPALPCDPWRTGMDGGRSRARHLRLKPARAAPVYPMGTGRGYCGLPTHMLITQYTVFHPGRGK